MSNKSFLVLSMVFLVILGFAPVCWGAIPIGEEDVLQISVWGYPDLTVTVPVRPGGLISVPFVGDVKAGGMTPKELRDVLEKEYEKFIKTPTVSVVVMAVNSFKVYIYGTGLMGTASGATGAASGAGSRAAEADSGAQPGVVTLRRETTLMQLLAMTGFQRDADLANAYLMRGATKLKVDFYGLVVHGDASQDIPLQPNDVIFVPISLEKRIKVVGAVRTPGIVPFSEGMTALDAILTSGGFTESASQNNVVVIRKEGNEVRNIRVRVKDILNGSDISQNLPLKPGDIIKVGESIF